MILRQKKIRPVIIKLIDKFNSYIKKEDIKKKDFGKKDIEKKDTEKINTKKIASNMVLIIIN